MIKYIKHNRGFGVLPVFTIIAAVLILAGGGYFAYQRLYEKKEDGVVCSAEAKLCPDGSSVGRTGPNCAFAACPAPKSYSSQEECEQATSVKCDYGMCDVIPPGKTLEEVCGKGFRQGWFPLPEETPATDTSNWKTYRNEQYGFEMRYPSYYAEDKEPRYPGDKEGEVEGDTLFFARPSDQLRYAESITVSIIRESVENYRFRDPYQKNIITPEAVTIGGLNAYVVEGTAILCWESHYYVPRGSFMARITFADCGEDGRAVAPREKILSTFKFTK